MKIILKETIKHVGKAGQIVEVKDGYARNYLIPKGFAVEANTKNVKSLEHEVRVLQERAKKIRGSAQDLADSVSAMTLTITAKAGEEGKLFGSITTMDVAEALLKQGIEIDKRKIVLEEPIKRIGVYSAQIKIHPEVSVQLSIQVIQE